MIYTVYIPIILIKDVEKGITIIMKTNLKNEIITIIWVKKQTVKYEGQQN